MPLDPNEHDRFVVRQRIRLVINEYEIALPDQPAFCFVQQKRFKFKEDIRFYADDSRSVELLRIKARQRFDPAATYDVVSAGGEKVGEIQKVFGESLIRSTYRINGASGSVTARESSLAVALFRRLVGFVPYVGGFADWLPIPYHFSLRRGDVEIGTYRRRLGIRDVYDLDLGGDPDRTLDRRLALAVAVGMDALQAR
jgi:uncharacterized protein YxjI